MKCKTCTFKIRCEQKKKKDRERWRDKYAKTDRRQIDHALKV